MVNLLLLFQWHAELNEHNLSRTSWVGFLNTCHFLVCLYMPDKFTSSWCHHGDSPSGVSFLQWGGQDLTMFNPVKYMCVNESMKVQPRRRREGVHERLCGSLG